MKKPKIGLSTKALDKRDLWYYNLSQLGSKVIEINNVRTHLAFKIHTLMRRKKDFKKYDLSMHSQTSRVFTNNSEFTEHELAVLKSEIYVCSIVGIKELIFHLKQDKLTKKQEKQLRKIIDYSKKKKVKMIYESNKDFYPDTCLDVLKRFPDIGYNLDLGHINIAHRLKYFNYSIDDFINKIKDRIVYIHLHNNNGKKDQHISLKKGTLNWKHILDLLDFKKIKKLIIEQHEMKDVTSTKKDLDNYFKKKKIKKKK